ncbi:hypothetical protein PZ895_12825 [Mesorhizobium sp. YIM 152430]|uniref:hypothetical protein n=1 Tax=Mesorhizobium sp. YIM 152430 TaxID=3031761 RepID=UPI0023DAA947|nr:hypothetical protein [Mesorhizobium sp. YIM 152430]MDF1600646.1 hypothetical protein [Mesorhizobium sp. YIM 152430]
MKLLSALETLAPVEALKVSFYAYPVVNGLHVLSVGTLIVSILLLDLRILGAFASLPEDAAMRVFRRLALTGFAGAVLTGLPMFAIQATTYAANPAFRIKMALLFVAGINAALFAILRSPRAGRGLAALSLVLWLGVLFAGRFIGFVE